ncbi:MAG: PEP-CTERM sorting domain-containing protein [Fimbriimonadaceae bacterium]
MRKLIWIVGAVVLGQSAQAAVMFIEGFVPGKSLEINVNYKGAGSTETAGAFAAHIDGGPMVEAYCVDLLNGGTIGQEYSFTPLSTNLLSNGARVAYLYSTFAPTIELGSTYDTLQKVREASAGLQLAIWDVLYDGGDGLFAGDLWSFEGGNVETYAGFFIGSSNGASEAIWAKADAHPDEMNQDLIVPVPEPATLAALGMGVAAFLRKRTGRTRKQR